MVRWGLPALVTPWSLHAEPDHPLCHWSWLVWCGLCWEHDLDLGHVLALLCHGLRPLQWPGLVPHHVTFGISSGSWLCPSQWGTPWHNSLLRGDCCHCPAKILVGLAGDGVQCMCHNCVFVETRLWKLAQKLSSPDCHQSCLSSWWSLPSLFVSSSHLVHLLLASDVVCVQMKGSPLALQVWSQGEQSWSAGIYSGTAKPRIWPCVIYIDLALFISWPLSEHICLKPLGFPYWRGFICWTQTGKQLYSSKKLMMWLKL